MKILNAAFLGTLVFSSFVWAEIPHSLTRLAEIQDKESEAYVFLAHQAAMDARLAANAELEGENSSGALKILGLATNVMPHRSDLKDLRNKALDTYISITKKLEEDIENNCEVLKERYSFLHSFAPDSIARLKYDKRCVKVVVKQDPFKIPEPRHLKDLEARFKADASHTTLNFPYEDVLNNMFMLFTSLYSDGFKISCAPQKIDGNKVTAQCSSTKKDEVSYRQVSLKYCAFLTELLIVPTGSKAVTCTIDGRNHIFRTSDSLYNVYVTAVKSPAFDDDIPVLVSMNMTIKKKDNSSQDVPVLVRLNQKDLKNGQFPRGVFEKAPEPYYFLMLGPQTKFELAEADIKNLRAIEFTINMKATYDKYLLHYEASTKQDLSCQDLREEIKGMESSRKKQNLEKDFKEDCPDNGNLEPRLLN